MIEVTGNLWEYPADVRVITTNGTVKKNGACVMGRGCAYEAMRKYPLLPKLLGGFIRIAGNVPYLLLSRQEAKDNTLLYSFPVKHNWYEKADLALIAASARELINIINIRNLGDIKTIVLPRPGCGNGNLKWEDVKPVLAPILDDRFHVITFKE